MNRRFSIRLQSALALFLVVGFDVTVARAQTASTPAQTPITRSAATPSTSAQQVPTPPQFPPPGWPDPVHDQRRHTFALADVLDFSPRGDESDVTWDVEGWHGGDYNRVWFKSEGEHSLTEAERDIDVQVLYGRFFGKYYDVQVGGGFQTATFEGRNVRRTQAVVGIEGFVPYKFDLETLLFISHRGDVSGRVTYLREYLMTQRLILQPRAEANIAAQRVEEFTVGQGLNNVELGLRLRYEFRREFGPYVGVAFDRSFFGTGDLIRAEGGDPSQWRFVAGVRAWR